MYKMQQQAFLVWLTERTCACVCLYPGPSRKTPYTELFRIAPFFSFAAVFAPFFFICCCVCAGGERVVIIPHATISHTDIVYLHHASNQSLEREREEGSRMQQEGGSGRLK